MDQNPLTTPLSRLAFLCAVTLLGGCPEAPSPHPQAPSVSAAELAKVLPKDADGKPILLEVGGLPITLGAETKDAISAAAECRDVFTSCVAATKDPDACAAKVPICKSERPWEEALPCCAQACVTAYQEERRLGADTFDANDAVFGSTHECFPGLQALYGGVPYLAPRRAPR